MRTPTQVYLKAAWLVAKGKRRFSCHAIADVETDYGWPLTKSYQDVFFPGGDSMAFAEEVEKFAGAFTAEVGDFRVLMLTLMAACWKDFQ